MGDLFDEEHHKDFLWNSEDSNLFRFFTVLIVYTDMIVVTVFLVAAARLLL